MADSDSADFGWQAQLRYALMFLTRLPVGLDGAPPPDALARAAWCFPLAGIAVGLAGTAAGSLALALALGLPPLGVAVIAIGACVLATGGLHEDGLADTADGFGGGASVARKLEIMRDSRIGSHGAVALILALMLRASLLSVAASRGAEVLGASLIVAHAVSRAGLPMLMRHLAPAREDGLGRMAGRPSTGVCALGMGLALLVAVSGFGFGPGIDIAAAAGVAVAGMGWLARRQIGGYTGDVLGGTQLAAELAALAAIAMLIGRETGIAS